MFSSMQPFNFSLINLWCTKNLVDSQHFLGRILDMSLRSHDYQVNYFSDPFDPETNFVFVNTCGFISSGREEADCTVKMLMKAGKTVYLMGCAVQYYKRLKGSGIREQELHIHYLSRRDMNTVGIKELMAWYDSKVYGDFEFTKAPRVYTNIEQKYEYLKIAEGCDNRCTFCIIPDIRGKQKSLPMENVLHEAKQMIANGIQEIILIAQDTTRYGNDLYGEPKLLELLKKLDKLKWDFTYRLLYLYPDIVTLNQIKELGKLEKFIPYFDIPLQHISSNILKKMGRFYDEAYIQIFIDQIKKSFPIRFIRTNLIIGFPGETEKDFEKLMTFIKEVHFDNVALFEYHDEPLAASSRLPDKVDDHTIRTRFTKIRQLVNKQLLEIEQARKGMQEIWYVTEIEAVKNWKIERLTVRPWLHCPEIDSYDEIPLSQIIAAIEDWIDVKIWQKILYNV